MANFAILTEANQYWLIDGVPYNVRGHAYVGYPDDDYQIWLIDHVPIEITAADLRSALRDASLPPFAPVSALQARRAMRAAAVYDAIAAAVDASLDQDLKDSWAYASEWHRDAVWIDTVAGLVGLTADQVDALFVQAAAL